MDPTWIYVIIGVVVGLIAVGVLWYCMSRDQNLRLRRELFEGEAYCIAVQVIKQNSSVLGKRKT